MGGRGCWLMNPGGSSFGENARYGILGDGGGDNSQGTLVRGS